MKKKSFLKKLSLLTAAVLLFSAMTLGTAAEETYDYDMEYYSQLKDKDVTINVYNWGEYISNGDDDSLDVNAEFEKLTGIRVNYTQFDTNESLYAKLKSGGTTYDVIFPSGLQSVYRLYQSCNSGNHAGYRFGLFDGADLLDG